MQCNIGLLSEFEKKYPDAHLNDCKLSSKGLEITMGVANKKKNELWIFVDRIALVKQNIKYIIPAITDTIIHEILHLFGYDEHNARLGEKMVGIK